MPQQDGPAPRDPDPGRRRVVGARRRLAVSVGLASIAVVAASVTLPGYAADDRPGARLLDRAASASGATGTGDGDGAAGSGAAGDADLTDRAPDGHDHDHSAPATKNSLSRSVDDAESDPLALDPTTAEQVAANLESVAADRKRNEPTLVPGPCPALSTLPPSRGPSPPRTSRAATPTGPSPGAGRRTASG